MSHLHEEPRHVWHKDSLSWRRLKLPGSSKNVPIGQFVQLVCVFFSWNRPASHTLQPLNPTWLVYFPTIQSTQVELVYWSSFSTRGPWKPIGQPWQDVAWTNGFKKGCTMKVPGEQHAYWPLLVDEMDASFHCSPHNVRLNALLTNTGDENNGDCLMC